MKPRQHGIKRLGSGELVKNAPLLQQYYCRDTTDTEARSQSRIFPGIDLDHSCFAGKFFSNRSHHRCKGVTVRSGGGPEFSQHRAWIRVDE